MDYSDGGKVHRFLGAEISSLIVCTSEGCHPGTVASLDGKHLAFQWEEDGEPARQILRADSAD